ncbi:hypothetical protein D3C73_530820 [compost metagenome]
MVRQRIVRRAGKTGLAVLIENGIFEADRQLAHGPFQIEDQLSGTVDRAPADRRLDPAKRKIAGLHHPFHMGGNHMRG